MINEPTTLILGAGASSPYGLPLGRELFDKIIESLDSKSNVYEHLSKSDYSPLQIDSFKDALKFSGTSTIDQFLEYRKEFRDIGKAAICLSLIPYENEEKLFNNDSKNWYKILLDNMNAEEHLFEYNKINIITFNYDRSLEHFLYKSLQNKYGIDIYKAGEILRKINIVHVHGMLGKLPYLDNEIIKYFWVRRYDNLVDNHKYGVTDENKQYFREYKSTISYSVVRECVKNINTIFDLNDTSVFNNIYDLLEDSKNIFFLGFGFNELNIKRLGIKKISKNKFIGGTSIGLSENQKIKISEITGDAIKPYNLKNIDISSYLSQEVFLAR